MLRSVCSSSYRVVRPRLVLEASSSSLAARPCPARSQRCVSSIAARPAAPSLLSTSLSRRTEKQRIQSTKGRSVNTDSSSPRPNAASPSLNWGFANPQLRSNNASSRGNNRQQGTTNANGAAPSPVGTHFHKLHVKASRNNTIITLTAPNGDPLFSSSGGSAGFRKSARSGYEAGYRAAFQVFKEIAAKQVEWRVNSIEVHFNGFGQGREAFFRALLATEGQGTRVMVRRLTDTTRLKVGGVRPKKRRML